jgi:hypothetical protein
MKATITEMEDGRYECIYEDREGRLVRSEGVKPTAALSNAIKQYHRFLEMIKHAEREKKENNTHEDVSDNLIGISLRVSLTFLYPFANPDRIIKVFIPNVSSPATAATVRFVDDVIRNKAYELGLSAMHHSGVIDARAVYRNEREELISFYLDKGMGTYHFGPMIGLNNV